ncbi:MAG: hypothetical protein IIB45_02015 [Candidatus Marinimicrobia bacterium]|nr:hypothetical protein [Candidatus Neomarinimicrobiota bacterium]
MINVRYPRSIINRLKKYIYQISIPALLLFVYACDFDSPSDFEVPTWYIDLKFPLVQERYRLDEIVDNVQIFLASDSLGMQIIFEDTLPKTSIDPSYLEVNVGADIAFEGTPTTSPSLTVVVDTIINVTIPFAPAGLVDISGETFSVPPGSDKQIFASTWNQIVAAFDTTFPAIQIDLPAIDESELPVFITEISGVMIINDGISDSSFFYSSITNNGMLTDVTDVRFSMFTGSSIAPDTLADHQQNTVVKDDTFARRTLIGDQQLKNSIRMLFDFDVASYTGDDTDILTVSSNDSVQVNFSIRIRIAGVDEAVVEIAEYDMPTELDPVTFPSDIEIYSGIFKTGTSFGVNEIVISNLKSTYPFYMDFIMNFRNFVPPAGSDSVKIDTALFRDYSTYSKTFFIDGYTFSNPAGSDSALSELVIDLTARLRQQTAFIPLDGSELGKITINVTVDELHFQSLEANIIESFPPSIQNIAGMPTGFSGMAFTGVQFEFDMVNSIDLPVQLDVDMVGYNTLGDSSIVEVRAEIAKPSTYGSDSTRTIIRLSKIGTTVLSYATTDASTWTDSVTTPPSEGTSTIVDLLSFNPAVMIIRSAARIDGRGTIVGGAAIGGQYRMIAPFEVIMDPMTFISVTETPIEEFAHDMRNKIRSSLIFAQITSTVTNSIPISGDISILLSNKKLFPLDTTPEMLSIFRDSLAAQDPSWSVTDSIYVLNECSRLNPDSTAADLYIFGVMDDFDNCIDGVVYLVKFNPAGKDTIISYVDTLLKVILPEPAEYYSDTSTVGHPGQVATPGVISYTSEIDTNKLFLLTDYGDHYTAPRFHLNGSNGRSVYLTVNDYIDISTFLVLRLSNTGMFETAPDELVILYPNGGETLNAGNEYFIKWKTYGSVSTVDLQYATGTDPGENDWVEIESDVVNVDSLSWTPTVNSDSVRIRIRDPNSVDNKTGKYKTEDVNGWYFSVTGGRAAKLSGEPPIVQSHRGGFNQR